MLKWEDMLGTWKGMPEEARLDSRVRLTVYVAGATAFTQHVIPEPRRSELLQILRAGGLFAWNDALTDDENALGVAYVTAQNENKE